jgi:hypothetical protein
MKTGGLLVAAAVLAALTGVLYWSDHHKPSESAATPAEAPAPKILTLKDADISKIAIQKKGAEEVLLAKNAAGKWQITAPQAFSADQDAVSSMVSTLSSLSSERLVDEKAGDLKQYGLVDPSLEVDIATKDKPQKLLIGDDTPTGGGAFAMLAGDPRVFTVASYTKTSVDKSANDLRDKRLLTADFDKISQIELTAKKQDIVFGRNKDAWQIVKPKPLRADNFQVEDLSRKLKDAKMDLSAADADAKKATTAFASATPIAVARVTDAGGTQELQIRKSKDDYYAKSSAVAGVYKVASDLGTGLDKSLDDFRSKKLFDFGFDDPNKVEMHDGSKAYFLTKGGQDWWSDGKKMDSASVQSFVDKVRELAASKFVDSGFSTAAVDVAVTSSDGKRVEHVLVAKKGDKYIAKREDEPALYELEAAAVTDLQKAAAEIKPAPPEEKPAAPAKKK